MYAVNEIIPIFLALIGLVVLEVLWHFAGWKWALRALVAGVAVLFLGGCTTAHQAAVQGAIEEVKQFNDTTATTLIQSTCGMTVGAFNRLENPHYQRGVDLLCGGNGEDPITLQDLQRFMAAQ